MGLLGYEMYTHLQSLRAMHPSTRSEVTNQCLEKLYPWYQARYLMPGSTVRGCLACALGRLYNDGAAMNAVAVLARSGRRRGKWPKEIIYPLLVKEGWLGVWAEGVRGMSDVMRDRNEARKVTGVNTREWSDRGEGVEFKPVVWGQKKAPQGSYSASGLHRGGSSASSLRRDRKEPRLAGPQRPDRPKWLTLGVSVIGKQAKPAGPARPDRPKGLTLGVSILGEQKKRWTSPATDGHQGVFQKPPVPERSNRRQEVRSESPLSPLSPKSRRSEMQASSQASQKRRSQPPPPSIQRSYTTSTRPPPRRADSNNVTIPAPLRVASQKAKKTNNNPFQDPQLSKSTRGAAKAPPPTNPFFSHEERKWAFPSSSDDEDDDDEEDEGANIVRPSRIGDEYSDSDYSADETEQRYMDEHDELLKMVGGVGFGNRPRTKDYLNTLPRMDSRA
ncbi:MAG: hypothetical protein Q9184_007020 [Pyrenodesmia sp. 2 TL-2023]